MAMLIFIWNIWCNVHEHGLCAQIVGDIMAARDALVQVTSRLRSYVYRETSLPKDLPPPPVSSSGHISSTLVEASSPNRNSAHEDHQGSDPSTAGYQIMQTATTSLQSKVTIIGFSDICLAVYFFT